MYFTGNHFQEFEYLFHVSTSSYDCRARCVTLESETERFYVHTYLRTVITSEWKERKTLSFFIRSVARILMGQRKLAQRRHKLLRRPYNRTRVEKILKIAFENVSKTDYIARVSGLLKDIEHSLSPKYWKIRAWPSRKFRTGGKPGSSLHFLRLCLSR